MLVYMCAYDRTSVRKCVYFARQATHKEIDMLLGTSLEKYIQYFSRHGPRRWLSMVIRPMDSPPDKKRLYPMRKM